jgi:serine protease
VTGQKASVLTFDRKAALSARGAGRLIRSARLEVDLLSGSAAIDAYPMRQDWDETRATWTCAKDQDAASATSRCHMVDRWEIARRPHTKDNPYNPDVGVQGTPSGGKVVFDVTQALKRFLSFESNVGPLGWILQSRAGGSSVLSSREGNKPAKLVIDAVPFTDVDFASQAPFSFAVDASLATSATLPTLDGQPRPLAVLKPSVGTALKFAQNELLASTDNQAELDAIKARWAATEIGAPTTPIPGIPKGHVLRIDTTRADVATLVPNLREGVNAPVGLQKVSSSAALGLLAAAAAERGRGTLVGVNWLAPGAQVDIAGVNDQSLTDGAPVDTSSSALETSSNAYDWRHFQMHEVTQAWDLLFFSKKLKPVINAAIVDGGFSLDFQDERDLALFACANDSCSNPFECGGDTPCPWHGVHTASSGFGEPNNLYGGAGPGAGVSKLTLYFGAGDMATTLISVPGLVLAGADIINFSNAIPVPFWASFSTLPAEQVMWAARHVAGTLIFAAAGNENINVDQDACYFVLFGNVCPWEEFTWFPCEGSGVACVGATNYGDKDRASYSNYGGSVEYWASGTAIAGADPSSSADGSKYHFESGTSFSSPFIAGTAALTWAANANQLHAGDVEDCLNAAKFGGPDGRFVDTYFATACGLGNPSNLAPIVEIVQPDEEDVALASLGLVQIQAKAGDFEDGPITTFGWSDENGESLGTTSGGQPLLYAPPGPGLHKITVTVFDAAGKTGTDTVTFSATPAPPNLKILSPAGDGEEVFLGLPVDLVGRMTNFSGILGLPPYDTSNWVGYHENTILFDHLLGASTQATFNQVGNGHVTWSMTVDGQVGSASRSFKVISDGKLHVKITSPAKDAQLVNGQLNVSLTNDVAATLSAASTSDAGASVTYNWSVTKVSFTGVSSPVATFAGQSVSFTPTAFPCGSTKIDLSVTAINDLGQMDNDHVQGTVYKQCEPE